MPQPTHDILETIPLLSTDSKSELPCHVVADVELNGVRFVLLTPKHAWVTVVRDDEDGIVELDSSEIGELEGLFNAALAQHGLKLQVESDEILLVGDLKEDFTELCDTIGITEDDDEDAYIILSDVEHNDATYLLLSPELPAMFAAKIKDGKGHPLSEAELEKVEAKLEEALSERVN